MAARNGDKKGTAFTVSIEAAEGVTTGISAADRARTVQAAVAAHARPEDLVQPGHIFPLQAVDGGVLMRAGHTEAGCDLAAMAGCSPGLRHLRDHEGRRHHGAAAGPATVCG
jgi:3,4-dihydroxy 2-butanone 4-phosphate synthase/GTP cyclohydrolase II